MTQRWQRAPLEKNDEHYARERVRVSDDSLPRPGFSAHNEVVLRRAVGPQSIKRRSEQVAAMRKSTAVYFEWLAQKETRDYDRRQRLSEVARFYRSLAGIIPAMPTQYKINDVGPFVTRADRWHARAEECRTLADCFTDPTCREQLRRLVQSYDCMAVAAE